MKITMTRPRLILTGLTLASILVMAVGTVAADQNNRPIATPFDDASVLQAGTGETAAGGIGVASVNEIATASDPADMSAALIAGADYLKGAQADVTEDNAGNGDPDVPDDPDDGGWDWRLTSPDFTHSTSNSPTNIYGATAMGLYYAYLETEEATYMTAMQDAADVMILNADIDSAADLIFLMRFQDLPGVTANTYQDAAKTKFDARIADKGSATAFAQYIRDARAGQGYENGIIPWDIGAWAVAAQMLEDRYPSDAYDYAQAADDIAEVIYQDSFNNNPGYFDLTSDKNTGWDPTGSNTNYWWFSLGITGLIDAFEAAGVHTAEIPGLVDLLLDCQYAGGAFSDSYGANTDNEDWQDTAYAIMSLARLDQDAYQSEINKAAYWLSSTQDDASGAWVYSSGNHYPEVGGEATSALYFGEPMMSLDFEDPGWLAACEDDEITADVLLTADGFNGVEFKLIFNENRLEVTDVSVGSMWSSYSSINLKADYTNSTVEFASYLQDADTNISVNEAQVATITFKEKNVAGDQDVLFDYVIVSNTDGETILDSGTDTELEVKPCGCVQGDVELQGRFVNGGDTDHHKGASVTVSGGPGGRSYTGSTTTTTQDKGTWKICQVVEGTYDIAVEMDLYLSAAKTDPVSVSASTADAGFVKMLGGDCNLPGNDTIGSGDAAVVAGTFGLSFGDTGYVDDGDINDDNTVNILDCSILGGNYGKTGPTAW